VDDKNKNIVVVCGARCIYQKDGKCKRNIKIIAATIGTDGKCVKFETKEEK
jgi:hypothetical protein